MISLKRKAELLNRHIEAVELLNKLTTFGYIELEVANRISFEHIECLQAEERDWLLVQIKEPAEEELEIKKVTELLYEILHFLIEIDGTDPALFTLKIHPDFSGVLCKRYEDEDGGEDGEDSKRIQEEEILLFKFDSFEDCAKRMRYFMKNVNPF